MPFQIDRAMSWGYPVAPPTLSGLEEAEHRDAGEDRRDPGDLVAGEPLV